jgi:endoribonuclease Dicer
MSLTSQYLRRTNLSRYDLFDSQLSYANCRARTRGQGSHLVHVTQRGCDSHRRRLLQTTRLDEATQIWFDNVLQSPESAIPPATMLDSHDPYLSDSEDEDGPASYIKDPTTGGRIRVQDATGIIYRFSANASTAEVAPGQSPALFQFESAPESQESQTQFICTVMLPPGPRVPPVSGLPSTSRAHARRVACYRMCQELFERGLLDPQMFPRSSLKTIGQRRIPDVSRTLDCTEEDLIATISTQLTAASKQSGVHGYPRKKPGLWENMVALKSDSLYPTVISVQGRETYGPLVLLTRAPLACMSSLKLFDSGFRIAVDLQRGARFDVDAERLHDLYRYTIRIHRSIVNKPLICQLQDMPYYLAPLKTSWLGFSRPRADRWHIDELVNDIPWDLVKLAADNWVTELQTENLEASIEDAIVQDRWIEYTRRYYALRLRRDLTPLSKPVDSPVSFILIILERFNLSFSAGSRV